MNIVEKMKGDWNRRANHDAKFWVDTTHYQNDEIFNRAGERGVTQFLELLGPHINSSWHVLDVGCGIGRMIRPMASHFECISGVDVSGEMVSKARHWLRNIENATVFENNGIDLKLFESSQFELVYSSIAFQHMPREVFDNYLSEINRVLKPNGFLEFQMYVGVYRDPPFEDTLTIRVYEQDELLDRLKNHGFSLVNKSIEPSTREGLENWIVLARKVGSYNPSSELSWLDKYCERKASALEIQLSFQLAKNHIQKGRITEAEKTLRFLVTTNPGFLDGWLELGILLINEGRIDEGIRTLENMLDAHPVFFPAYFSIAEIYKKTGRDDNILYVQKRLRGYQDEISQVLADIERLVPEKRTTS